MESWQKPLLAALCFSAVIYVCAYNVAPSNTRSGIEFIGIYADIISPLQKHKLYPT